MLEVEVPSADRNHSEADWNRATLHHRNPRPTSAPRARTLRQDLLPGGCSPHINACPRRRFRIPTAAVMTFATTTVCAALRRTQAYAGSTRRLHKALSAKPARAPRIWATMNAGASAGRMPANVSERARAIVMAGFAKDVEAVNQYAAPIHAGTRHAACGGVAHDNATVIRPAVATISESNCPSPALACVAV